MLASSKENSPKDTVTRQVVQDLARAVGKSPMLQLAERSIDALRREQSERGEEYNAYHAGTRDKRNPVSLSQIAGHLPRIEELKGQIVAERSKARDLRLAHSAKVANQLSAIRKEAAARVLAALEELDSASEVLIACCDEIRLAGNPDTPYLQMVPSFSMRDHATRLLTSSK